MTNPTDRINAMIAAAKAKPLTHRVVTLLEDGTSREHDTRGVGQAENFADLERRKIGRKLIDRMTGKPVNVIAVYVERI